MTDPINVIKSSIDALDLNSRALQTLNKIKADSNDAYPDFLNGFSRDEIIFRPKRQYLELYNQSGFDPNVVTEIGIYIKDASNSWKDNLKPIGVFYYQTTIDGEYLDDSLNITGRKHSS